MYLIFKISALHVLPISGKESFTSTDGCICQTSLSRRTHQQEACFSAGCWFFLTSRGIVNTHYTAQKETCQNARVTLCQGILLIKRWTIENIIFFFFFPLTVASISLFSYVYIYIYTYTYCAALLFHWPVKAVCQR